MERLPGSLVCSMPRVPPGAVVSTQWGTVELPGPPSQTHTVCPLAELSRWTPVYVRLLRGPLALLLLKGRYRGTEIFHLLIGSLNAHKVGGGAAGPGQSQELGSQSGLPGEYWSHHLLPPRVEEVVNKRENRQRSRKGLEWDLNPGTLIRMQAAKPCLDH